PAPTRTPARTTAPEPMAARRSTIEPSSSQSPPALSSPSSVVARGRRSFTNITPWPTNTSSPISTPEQMNVWLWILQRAPTTAPAWISTNGPTRVRAPMRQPYRFVNEWTNTSSPNSTPEISRYGASLPGSGAIVEESPDRVAHPADLLLADAGVERERDQLGAQALGDGERTGAVAERGIGGGEVRRLGIVAAGGDAAVGQMRPQALGAGRAHRVEVPHRPAAGRHGQRAHVADAG